MLGVEVDPRHDHARHPEEEDLRGGHEHVGRVEGAQVGRVVRPPERGHRPEPARGPGVEHVFVLAHGAVAVGAARRVLAERRGPPARIAVEHRDPVPPPQLPRDVPVADGLHPVHVHPFPALGEHAHAAVLHRLEGGGGQRRHLHEPLIAEARLHHRFAAIAAADRVTVLLDLHEVSGRLERGRELLARDEPVEPAELRRHPAHGVSPLAHGARLVDHHRHGQTVPLAHVEIVGVVRRGDLERAGAKRAVHVAIGDDGDLDAHDGDRHPLPHEVGVALVVGVHGNGDVGEDRLRSRRRDHERTPRLPHDRIGDLPELSVRLLELGFLVGQRREAARAPVDHAMAAIDQLILVQAHERLAHRTGARRIEGVRGAAPVGAHADRPQLLQDHAPGLGHERLHALDERLAPDLEARLAFLGEELFHDVLRGDAGVVGARHPERVVAGHAPPAHDDVLHGVVEAVPDVEHRRHVRRRHHHGEGAAARRAIGCRREDAGRFPAPVQGALGGGGVVGGREVRRGGRRARHGKGETNGSPRAPWQPSRATGRLRARCRGPPGERAADPASSCLPSH